MLDCYLIDTSRGRVLFQTLKLNNEISFLLVLIKHQKNYAVIYWGKYFLLSHCKTSNDFRNVFMKAKWINLLKIKWSNTQSNHPGRMMCLSKCLLTFSLDRNSPSLHDRFLSASRKTAVESLSWSDYWVNENLKVLCMTVCKLFGSFRWKRHAFMNTLHFQILYELFSITMWKKNNENVICRKID